MLRQWFCGPCFLRHACDACHCPTCQLFFEHGFPDGVQRVTRIRPDKNARTTLLYRTLDTYGDAAASPCSRRRPGHKIGCRIFCGGPLALSAQYLPHCLRKRDNNKHFHSTYGNLVTTSLSDPPLSQKGGVGGTRAIAHSIRRCRATGVAKLACYPGCCRCRRPPPSRCFLKVALKNDAPACISEHFCILRISNLEKSEFSLKSFILLVFWRFLGILGGSKNRQKTKEIHQKVTGRERRSSGTVFGPFLKHFFANFKAQNTVKYNVFALFVLKDNNVKMLQKHRKYRCF